MCVVCEYDALPEIGHACGHNLIAEAGVAAGLGVKAYLETTGSSGSITVLGTPAEEGGGGKILLIERGAFNDIDVAIMAHPAPFDCVITHNSAMTSLSVEYKGKAAHAAAFPWEGVNALDAAVLAYTNISLLRHQMKPTWRAHAIFTNGGTKPNIIPEKASLCYYIRAPHFSELRQLQKKVVDCFEAAAQATGCMVEVKEDGKPYANVKSNQILAELYRSHLEKAGVQHSFEGNTAGSTDMGNVSYVVPSLHPCYRIGSGEVNHTREFTGVTNTTEAHDKTRVIAATLALTLIEVIKGGKELVKKIKDNFAGQISSQN